MLAGLILAAAVQTLTLDGEVVDDSGDYAIVEFEVPAGVVEIEVAHRSDDGDNILDWGLWDPNGFRGWGGGLEDNAVVGATAASRGYLPGPIPTGTWELVIGKAQINTSPAPYSVTVTLRDAETLTPRARAAFAGAVLETGARWYRGDLHVHSRESGDASATFDDIVALMRERGLDFAALSDHNTVSQHALIAARQAEYDDALLMRAAEITTYGGHANAFGFADYVDHRVGLDDRAASAIVADVKAQGGLISINHPALDLGPLCIGCAWVHEDTPWSDVDAIEIHTGNYEAVIGIFTPRAIAMWDEQLDAGHRLTAVGGSDDHRAGQGLSDTQSPIGSPTTLVYTDELSESAILEGIRDGRVVVQLRGPDDPFVELFVEAGGERKMIGDTVAGPEARVEVHVVGGAGLEVLLFRNGEPVEVAPLDGEDVTQTWTFPTAQAGDRYRAHVVLGSLDVVVTNHVWVEYADGDGDGGCGCNAGSGRDGTWLALAVALALVRRRRSVSRL